MGGRQGRVEPHGLRIAGGRFSRLSEPCPDQAQVQVDVRRRGREAQGLLLLRERLLQPSLTRQHQSERAPRLDVTGTDPHRFPIIPLGPREVSALRQRRREIVVGHRVVAGHADGVGEQAGGASPMFDLRARQGHPAPERQCRRPRRDPPDERRGARQVRGAPGQHDAHADDRDVHEPVGMGLRAGLHDAEHGQQRQGEPGGAGQDVGPPAGGAHHGPGGHAEEQPGQDDAPAEQAPRDVRIRHRQANRPDDLADVHDERPDGVGDPSRQRYVLQRAQVASARVSEEGGGGGKEGEDKKRRLFDEQRCHPRTAGQPPQRPEVEGEQHQRQRDQCRLRHEPGRHQHHRGRVGGTAAGRCVAGVRDHGQGPEQSAEDVLALGDPGHGLDGQGMHGEDGSREAATPQRAGQAVEQEEDQRGVERVQGRVHHMVSGRVQAEHLHVQHPREDRHRHPVVGVRRFEREVCGEGPAHAFPGEPARDQRMAVHVEVVVEGHEAAASNPL